MNIGKAAILALVASWAIYGQERVRIPVEKGGFVFSSGGGGPTVRGYGPSPPRYAGDGGKPYR